jgi:hypothetical protein
VAGVSQLARVVGLALAIGLAGCSSSGGPYYCGVACSEDAMFFGPPPDHSVITDMSAFDLSCSGDGGCADAE